MLEEWGRHDKVGGPQECPNCEACKESVEHVLFKCASYVSQRLDFLDCLKIVLLADAFEAILHGSIIDKIAFCLRKAKYTGK